MTTEENDRIIDGKPRPEDQFDRALRPSYLDELIGQEQIKENLRILIEAAKLRSEALAHILANEMSVSIKVTSGPAIERAGDLAAILTNLHAGDILFIDEIHRLGRVVEEVLYPAMEDFSLDIVIGKGPAARSIRLKLPHFTVVGATTRLALVTSPLRARFGATYRLD